MSQREDNCLRMNDVLYHSDRYMTDRSYGRVRRTTKRSQPEEKQQLSNLQILAEPSNGLIEGLFLGKLVVFVFQVSADSKTVHDTAEEVNLPGLTGLAQRGLGFMAQLSCEDLIRFYEQTSAPNVRSRLLAAYMGPQAGRVVTYPQQQWRAGP